MPLFLDRFPFHCWMDQTKSPPRELWSVVVPVLVAEQGLPAPLPTVSPQRWVVDTGNRGDAFAWRRHLLTAGLDPAVKRSPRTVSITTAVGGKQRVPVRLADLWLVSNLPALQGSPWRLVLDPGIPFLDVAALPDPEFNRPLIGLRTLCRAGLRVELDCAQDTVSVWTPDPVP